uniref:Uncharacterized protein n=1 Tax=Plectus sambesii TaxID=2011161 RepID=A0A914WZQ6_9BILA
MDSSCRGGDYRSSRGGGRGGVDGGHQSGGYRGANYCGDSRGNTASNARGAFRQQAGFGTSVSVGEPWTGKRSRPYAALAAEAGGSGRVSETLTLAADLCRWSMEWHGGLRKQYMVKRALFSRVLSGEIAIVERRAATALGALLTRHLQGYAAVQSSELVELEALEERERLEMKAEKVELVRSDEMKAELARAHSARVAAEEARLAAEAASSATFAQFQEFLVFRALQAKKTLKMD